jgi:DNA mismatch endonuclease (patch repair protein)
LLGYVRNVEADSVSKSKDHPQFRRFAWVLLIERQPMARSVGAGTPQALNATVRSNMRRMPTRDSVPEVQLRSRLHRLGLRYRLHQASLPGRPDIVFASARVAVFVDGCFWHWCPTHCTVPRHNRDWWLQKLEGTRRRDRLKDNALAAQGWLAIHVWEHQNMDAAATRIAGVINKRRSLFRSG